MNDHSSPAGTTEHSNADVRGVWESPTVEELDFASTEFTNKPFGGADAALYQS